jgi:hypothetical protein
MTAISDSVELAGVPLGDCRHVCAFFLTAADEYRTLLPFVRDGLEHGERGVQVVPSARADHLEHLRAAGIDVQSALDSGQLEVRHSEDTYLHDGHFDQDTMLSRLPGLLDEGRKRGFSRTRLIAHAEFVLAEEGDSLAFVEYEARLNHVLAHYRDIVICSYDLGQVGAASAMDALRTHPMVIIAGVLRKNPFYVAPEEFIAELRRRPHRREGRMAAQGGDRRPTAVARAPRSTTPPARSRTPTDPSPD